MANFTTIFDLSTTLDIIEPNILDNYRDLVKIDVLNIYEK